MPVAAGQPVHQPGEALGQEAELARDRAVRVVDVRQHADPVVSSTPAARCEPVTCNAGPSTANASAALKRVIPAPASLGSYSWMASTVACGDKPGTWSARGGGGARAAKKARFGSLGNRLVKRPEPGAGNQYG